MRKYGDLLTELRLGEQLSNNPADCKTFGDSANAIDALCAEIKKIEANADYHADANVALVGDVERLTAEGANYRIALEQIRDSELAMSDIIDLATIVLEPVSTGQADE